MTTNDIIERILRKAVPEVSNEHIYHQMEYLRARIGNNTYELRGSFGNIAAFIRPFYGMSAELVPLIEEALDRHYHTTLLEFSHSVMEVISHLQFQKITPDTLWLSEKKEHPINMSHYLGLKVIYHKGDDEFITALDYERAVRLL